MFKWVGENAETIVGFLTVVSAIGGYIVSILVKMGKVQKKRGDIITAAIEDAEDVGKRTLQHLRKAKADGELTDAEIAEALVRSIKAEVRQRAVKTGVKSVIGAIADGVAEVDEKKPRRSFLRRVSSLMRPGG